MATVTTPDVNQAAAASRGGSGRVLVVIPCLNEEAHLGGLLESFRGAEVDRIVVVDGGSHDASVAIARAAADADPRICVLDNPKKIQSAAINLAVETFGAGTEYLVRVDAHAGYPGGYVERLVEACEAEGADSVTVSMLARSQERGGCFQIAAASVQNSVLGTGGSAHRAAGARRWVDHGHHALFRTDAFRRIGGYDETFSHNEDAEFDARLGAAGGRILLAGDIVIDYYPRSTAGGLWRQYYRFGRGRARMLLRHRQVPKIRQAPPLAVAPVVVLAAAAPLSLWAGLPATAWLAACLGFGALLGARDGRPCAFASGLAAAIMHLAWSAGFWVQLAASARRPA